MHLRPISALKDNYIWLLSDDQGHALVVDPGESEPVRQELLRHDLVLTHILLTHHHHDHIGGSAELAAQFGARIVAPKDERITHADQRVGDGDVLTLERPKCRFSVLEVPGHTLSHIAYFGAGLLFCGDTLFSLGCGRLFEGTPAQMLASLDRLSVLPADTQVCCGHEYTVDNARFALTVDPDNAALRKRARQAGEQRASGQTTVPTSLAQERDTNPFLRVDRDSIKTWGRNAGVTADRVQLFAALRRAKDEFRA